MPWGKPSPNSKSIKSLCECECARASFMRRINAAEFSLSLLILWGAMVGCWDGGRSSLFSLIYHSGCRRSTSMFCFTYFYFYFLFASLFRFMWMFHVLFIGQKVCRWFEIAGINQSDFLVQSQRNHFVVIRPIIWFFKCQFVDLLTKLEKKLNLKM